MATVAAEPLNLPTKFEFRFRAVNDDSLRRATALAREAQVSVLAVDPSDLDLARRLLDGSDIRLAAQCGNRSGTATTSVKVYETRDAIRRGARQVNIALNTVQLESRNFQFVEMELIQLAQSCHEAGALLKVFLQADRLGEEQRLVACKIAKRSEVDIVQSGESAGSPEDEALILRKCSPIVKVHRGAATLEGALAAIESGCEAVSGSSLELLDEWRQSIKPPVVT